MGRIRRAEVFIGTTNKRSSFRTSIGRMAFEMTCFPLAYNNNRDNNNRDSHLYTKASTRFPKIIGTVTYIPKLLPDSQDS